MAGCGNDLGKEADEGVPIQLGDLKFNVQETRFLNPAQPDDKRVPGGPAAAPPAGQGLPRRLPDDRTTRATTPSGCPTNAEMSVVDTTGAAYQSIPSHTDFAAPLGSALAAGGDMPAPGTAAANGPTQGALVLFLVDQSVSENRPLKLEIEYAGRDGRDHARYLGVAAREPSVAMRKTQLQALLVIGGVGAALALIQLLGVAGGLVGVGPDGLCTILTAPAAPRAGRRRAQLVGAARRRDGAGADRRAARPGPGGARAACSPPSAAGLAIVGVAFGDARSVAGARSRDLMAKPSVATAPSRGSPARSARRSCRRRPRRRSASRRSPASACRPGRRR